MKTNLQEENQLNKVLAQTSPTDVCGAVACDHPPRPASVGGVCVKGDAMDTDKTALAGALANAAGKTRVKAVVLDTETQRVVARYVLVAPAQRAAQQFGESAKVFVFPVPAGMLEMAAGLGITEPYEINLLGFSQHGLTDWGKSHNAHTAYRAVVNERMARHFDQSAVDALAGQMPVAQCEVAK